MVTLVPICLSVLSLPWARMEQVLRCKEAARLELGVGTDLLGLSWGEILVMN